VIKTSPREVTDRRESEPEQIGEKTADPLVTPPRGDIRGENLQISSNQMQHLADTEKRQYSTFGASQVKDYRDTPACDGAAPDRSLERVVW